MTDLPDRLWVAINELDTRRPETHIFGCASFDNCGTCRSGPYGCDCGEPDRILRRCAADTNRLNRHRPSVGGWRFKGTDTLICGHCSTDEEWGAVISPCPDLQDLAACYGVEV